MKRAVFFDTNIFVYADDVTQPEKKQQAIELIAEAQAKRVATVSLQVMQEYFAIATKKLGIDPALAQRKIELMRQMRVVRFEAEDVLRAIEIHRLHSFSFWDALILHAAKLGGAEILYSEDLQDGRRLDGVRIVNPFA